MRTREGRVYHEVEPTMRFIDLCATAQIKRFVRLIDCDLRCWRRVPNDYRGDGAESGRTASSTYARAKAEIESYLLERHRTDGFPPSSSARQSCFGVGRSLPWWRCFVTHPEHGDLLGHWAQQLPIVLVDDVADAFVKALIDPESKDVASTCRAPRPSQPRNTWTNRSGVRYSDSPEAGVARIVRVPRGGC